MKQFFFLRLLASAVAAMMFHLDVVAEPTPFVTNNVQCDADIRVVDTTCPLGRRCCPTGVVCRRVAGECGIFDGLCLDDPTVPVATAPNLAWICNEFCSNSEGRCANPPPDGSINALTCNTASDCPGFAELCAAGLCTHPAGGRYTLFNSCNDDTQCNDWQSCIDGICTDGDCTLPSDCSRFERCVRNMCVPKECIRDDTCAPNVCSAEGLCVECRDDAHCPGGTCMENHCVYECTSDFACPSNQRCSDNACVPKCPEDNTEHVKCGLIEACIEPGRTQACDGPADCLVDHVCCEGYCVDRCPDGPCPEDLPDPDPGGEGGSGPQDAYLNYYQALRAGDLGQITRTTTGSFAQRFFGEDGARRLRQERIARSDVVDVRQVQIEKNRAIVELSSLWGGVKVRGEAKLILEGGHWLVDEERWKTSDKN